MPDLRKTKRRLRALVERLRRARLIKKPCGECGRIPSIQYLNESGTNISDGRPFCKACADVLEATGGVSVIRGYGVDPEDEGTGAA